MLAYSSFSYTTVEAPAGSIASIKIGDKTIQGYDAHGLSKAESAAKDKEIKKELGEAIKAARYPTKPDPAQMQ